MQLSDSQLIVSKINIPYLQISQLTLPNPRLQKRHKNRVIPAVSLSFKEQRLVFVLKENCGVFFFFPRPYNGFCGVPGYDLILFQELEEMPY